MKIIALAGEKGGIGKTTLATNLALAAVEAGKSALIIDIDKQKSVKKWFNKRDDQHSILVTHQPEREGVENTLSIASESDIDYVFIDTKGDDSTFINYCLGKSDYILIPAAPCGFDLDGIEATVKAVQTLDKDGVTSIIFNQSRTSADRSEVGNLSLSGYGIHICKHMMKNYVDYLDSAYMGSTVIEYAPKGQAAQQIRDIFNWLEERLVRNILLEKMEGAGGEQKTAVA